MKLGNIYLYKMSVLVCSVPVEEVSVHLSLNQESLGFVEKTNKSTTLLSNMVTKLCLILYVSNYIEASTTE